MSTLPPPGSPGPRVLLVDDEVPIGTAFARLLRGVASSVSLVHDASGALERLRTGDYDVVVSDVSMPGMSGTELLRAIRERDQDIPVVLVTGGPSLGSAAAVVEHRAFRSLTKPVDGAVLRSAVLDAGRLGSLARANAARVEGRAQLDAAYRRAVSGLTLAYQPIVSAATRRTIGYEALMRSSEPALRDPLAVLEAAEKLGELHALGRHIRRLVAARLEATPVEGSIFVNLHAADLADEALYDPASPLSRHARRVVLELTERASLESISALERRLDDLRALGYRLAVDDLGAGYAGLDYFARVRPDVVKIDTSLVRGVDTDEVRRQVVASLASRAAGLGMVVVAEGVETPEERDTVVGSGCTLVQGYGLAEPGPAFPEARWT